MYRDRVIEVSLGGAHAQRHGKTLQHLVGAIADYMDADDFLFLSQRDQLHGDARLACREDVIHRHEAGLKNLHGIAMARARLLFAQAYGADGRMAEHHRGNILVIELAIALAAEQPVGQAPTGRNGHGRKSGVWRDIADRIQILHTGALKCIDHDVTAGVELDLQCLQSQAERGRNASDGPDQAVKRAECASVRELQLEPAGRRAFERARGGMGRDLADNFPEARAVFEEADAALGFPLSKLCFEGPEEELKLTENTQPAILTVSTAAFRALDSRGITPDFVAGHSLGEYSALVAAGSLDFATAVKLVRERGRYMQEAVPAGEGAMAAILGLSPADVTDICKKAANHEVVSPGNLNSPEQTVISGHAGAVKRGVEIASQSGAKRAVMLPVSAPFHSALMEPAQKRLEPDLRAAAFGPLRFPLITNADAEAIGSGEEAREALIRQVTLPVRWHDSVRDMIERGVNIFVEVGPGKVLSGILRQIDRSVRCFNVEDSASLRSTIDRIAQARTEPSDN